MPVYWNKPAAEGVEGQKKSSSLSKRRRKSSYHISTVSEYTRLSLDIADDFMMNEGISIPKSDAFAGALKETKPDKVAQLCANDWVDAIHTKPTQMIRQISIRSRTSGYQMDESSESVHTSSKLVVHTIQAATEYG